MRFFVVCLSLCLAVSTLASPVVKKLEKKSISNSLAPARSLEPASGTASASATALNDAPLQENKGGAPVGRAKKDTTTFCVEIRQNKPTKVDSAPTNTVVIPSSSASAGAHTFSELPCQPEYAQFLQPNGEIVIAQTGNCQPQELHIPLQPQPQHFTVPHVQPQQILVPQPQQFLLPQVQPQPLVVPHVQPLYQPIVRPQTFLKPTFKPLHHHVIPAPLPTIQHHTLPSSLPTIQHHTLPSSLPTIHHHTLPSSLPTIHHHTLPSSLPTIHHHTLPSSLPTFHHQPSFIRPLYQPIQPSPLSGIQCRCDEISLLAKNAAGAAPGAPGTNANGSADPTVAVAGATTGTDGNSLVQNPVNGQMTSVVPGVQTRQFSMVPMAQQMSFQPQALGGSYPMMTTSMSSGQMMPMGQMISGGSMMPMIRSGVVDDGFQSGSLGVRIGRDSDEKELKSEQSSGAAVDAVASESASSAKDASEPVKREAEAPSAEAKDDLAGARVAKFFMGEKAESSNRLD
ncbi:hypothetical protein QAD02_015625 [Eretmocerus hayati]|uniref:Uncharacterized protein n=1 Tax=Eretmocerus hayati TaxID=131215 RepID=A0ACC2P8V1_9HYME|nr:hypothetical protein QAD02_015625 [Eretmocerus hayati]